MSSSQKADLINMFHIYCVYSYRNASIGLRLAALRAGYQPKKMPTAEENANERAIDVPVITTGHPPNFPTDTEIAIPSTMPIMPPKTLMNIDSIIN